MKVLSVPVSGKHIVKGIGVHRDVESEGSLRQTLGLTNRNHIRHLRRIRLLNKLKSNNYTEYVNVNVADI